VAFVGALPEQIAVARDIVARSFACDAALQMGALQLGPHAEAPKSSLSPERTRPHLRSTQIPSRI